MPGATPRKLPQRTCIGCRAGQGKRQLVRIVRTPEQRIIIDPSGKANGRGAYLHSLRPCWEKALKGATIKNALKITPVAEDVEALRVFSASLPAEESEVL